jgi:hypothetical protein
VRERLLAIDVFSGAHRDNRDISVQMVRRRAENGVDRFLLFQHHAEVFVLGDAGVRPFRGIMLFDLGANGLPPGNATVVE